MTNKNRDQKSTAERPCVNICVQDRETQTCLGCGRTALEIETWHDLSYEEKTIILAQKDERLSALTNKRRKARRGRAKR